MKIPIGEASFNRLMPHQERMLCNGLVIFEEMLRLRSYSFRTLVMQLTKWMVVSLVAGVWWRSASAQEKADAEFIGDFELPYVARISLERTGAGLQISPDNTLVPPTASFPFNSGINLAFQASYKFINFSISPSLHRQTNNSSLVFASNIHDGAYTYGGKLGFYKNVAAIEDEKNINLHSAINLVLFSPYWLINTNHTRLSLAAVTDYSQSQRRSAGAFMFEVNPFFMHAGGGQGYIIPAEAQYGMRFGKMSGLKRLSVINLDLRPGYVYTKVFQEGIYFISGGLFLGPGFGYHSARPDSGIQRGMHWQSSLRMQGSLGYNGERYFVTGSFRYANSFTPVRSIGVLSDEGSFLLTFGVRFGALEKRLPNTLQEVIGR